MVGPGTMNYNTRALDELRAEGYTATVVERYDHYTRRRHDLFGILDVLAVGHGETLGVQVTSRGNMASRRRKMQGDPVLAELLAAGWLIQIYGYDKPDHSDTACRCAERKLTGRCRYRGRLWRRTVESLDR